MLEALRAEICVLNQDLPRYGLVTWTSGNMSGRDPESGLVVIKPSGVPFYELTPENQVIVDLAGSVIEGDLRPSSDVHAHLYLYRHRPDVMGVVHTHSNYATAFAALGRPIPVYLTAMADEFGGPIPVGAYAKVGNDEIGREIIRSIGDSPAILMKNHGVFAVGRILWFGHLVSPGVSGLCRSHGSRWVEEFLDQGDRVLGRSLGTPRFGWRQDITAAFAQVAAQALALFA